MKLFFKTKTLEWWQIGLVKISALFFGIAIGAYWPDTFEPVAGTLLVVALVIGVYLASVWMKNR
jgi:hypothetical protein